MAAPVEQAPLWLEAARGFSTPLSALVTGSFALATAFLGFRFGLTKSDHDLKIEKQRLEHQQELETAKALREERAKKLSLWRTSIVRHTDGSTETEQTAFRYLEFSRTEEFLSLRGYLGPITRQMMEGTYSGPWLSNHNVTYDQSLRESLLARIDELEKEWGLA